MCRRSPLALLALAVLLCACSGSSQTSGQDGPADPTTDPAAEPPSVDQYETFDPSAYEARPPERTTEVEHRVPRQLMRGRADEEIRRTVDGFRIQVFSARDKQVAQEFREKVRQWWKEDKEDAFAERGVAEEALAFVSKKYPKAFISRGTVTVTQ
ncbi:MAG: SPOR domain-containing protein [Bacteroidetes bacterium QH_2_64_74]|nr:MAG: SPOR domain-containing protein [Bacteroidetes bacterium QH_2_64_74]